jgi:hypothetical protein
MTCIANETTEAEPHEEIEITEEMIEVGLKELALFDWGDPGEWIVSAIYRGMANVDRNHQGISLGRGSGDNPTLLRNLSDNM